MYKRSAKPLAEFIHLTNEFGRYAIGTDFGKINYSSKEISFAVTTRISAGGCFFIVEIYEDDNDNGQLAEPRRKGV